jgi:hypothetical protein
MHAIHKLGLLALITLSHFSSPTLADTTVVNAVYVAGDRGGNVVTYGMKMLRLKQNRTQVRVTGACDSACTLLLALPKNQLCITQSASFNFHLPSGSSVQGNKRAAKYLLKNYPGWVRRWIASRGGLSSRLISMRHSDIGNNLPRCSSVASR